jgi:endo-1,4-beta-xylanase
MHKFSSYKKFIALGLMTAMCMTGCSTGGRNSGETPPQPVQNETKTEENANQTSTGNNTENGTATNDNSAGSVSDESESKNENAILRDAVRERLGGFVGCAVTGSEIDDPKVWDIITTHFESVTLGNELKPDALVGYSVGTCPGTEMAELNGEQIVVPKLDYSRAEKILNKILDWNEENPDRKIKVRGHVLVWHSQTPEWLFHEDYDKNKPYVTASEMDKRLEWYIRTVLTHFTGEDSKYKDLFYGWDVVNEAISDGTGTYRSDNENPNESLSEDRHGSNSSWWHVYQSNEFIINAFKYANKYAPEDLELYYNDYNECSMVKRNGIAKLLKEIKDAEGAPGEGTRISAMGMQGHYGMDSPSFVEIQDAAFKYCGIVGKVQITELDISASDEYDGTADTADAENERLAERYKKIYQSLNYINGLDDCEVSGITFWGTVDHYSWLQSRSNVGGGNTSGLPQMPLLFDQNYEPKPCFYVFTETE